MKSYEVRTYIPEKKQAGQRHWEGKTEEQQAVYQNRRRVRGGYGKSLLRRRGELVERSFAHCYETGGMRRTHLRGHENILKRQLVHVGAFNLSLILRQVLGAGTPRQWKDLEGTPFLLFIYYLLVGKIEIGSPEAESQYLVRNRSSNHEARLAARRGWSCRKLVTSTPGCYGFFAFLTVPPGPPFPEHLHKKKMCGIVWCYTGPINKAEKVFKPIRSFRAPALDMVGPIPHPVLQSLFDDLYPPGLQWYWKADFVRTLPDEAIALHLKHAAKLPTMQSTMHLYPVNGAASRVKNSATPWCYRDAMWAAVMVGVDPDPANKEKISTWAKEYWSALHPYSAGGAYINFMMEEGEDRIRATYGKNYDRLAKIKKRYDPANLFRINQNIKLT